MDLNSKIENLIDEQVNERVSLAWERILFEHDTRQEQWAKAKTILGDKAPDILAEIYAAGVACGDIKPTLNGKKIEISEGSDYAAFDFGKNRLRLHDA